MLLNIENSGEQNYERSEELFVNPNPDFSKGLPNGRSSVNQIRSQGVGFTVRRRENAGNHYSWGRGFNPRPRQTKVLKTGSSGFPLWRSELLE